MKNIHLIPTSQPSRLVKFFTNKFHLCKEILPIQDEEQYQNIYITSDEEIKEEDWVIENHTFKREPYIGKCFYPKNDGTVTDEVLKRDLLSVNYEGHYETLARKHNCKKIILTTDQDLIKDGVQAISDEFLELFVKNLNCESIEVCKNPFYEESNYEHYKIIIPQEEPQFVTVNIDLATGEDLGKVSYIPLPNVDYVPKQETLEEAAERIYDDNLFEYQKYRYGFIEGAKWQAKRMHSEEEVLIILDKFLTSMIKGEKTGLLEKWFEQFKKK